MPCGKKACCRLDYYGQALRQGRNLRDNRVIVSPNVLIPFPLRMKRKKTKITKLASKGTEGNIPEPSITPRTFRTHATKDSSLVGPKNQHASSHRTNKLDIQFAQLRRNYTRTEQISEQKKEKLTQTRKTPRSLAIATASATVGTTASPPATSIGLRIAGSTKSFCSQRPPKHEAVRARKQLGIKKPYSFLRKQNSDSDRRNQEPAREPAYR